MSLLTAEQQQDLLRLARASITSHLQDSPTPALPEGDAFRQRYGSFVTLHRGAELRGCLGWIEPRKPLAEQILHLARMAASQDHRFPPVAADELPELHVEISLLSPTRQVRDVAELEVGRDGLIISRGDKRGLLLPQVASERGWDVPTFLAQTCVKAGLPTDAWRDASIEAFSCEVFSESGARDR